MGWRPNLAGLLFLGAAASSSGFAISAPYLHDDKLTFQDIFALKRAQDVQISPDERFVAYIRAEADITIDGRRRSLWVVDRASGQEKQLAADAIEPRWSPDGSHIAVVVQSAAGGAELRTIRIDGGEIRVVAKLPSQPSAPVWSPDGGLIAFTRFVEDPAPRYVAPVAQPSEAKWAATPRIISSFTYQDDGARFGVSGNSRLFVVDSHGGEPRQLTFGKTTVDEDPVWTSDGRALLFTGNQGEGVGRSYSADRIYKVSPAGGTAAAISPAALGAHAPAVSTDGRWIAFAGSQPNDHDYQQSSLYVMDNQGDHLRPIAPALDREVGAPHFSADNSSIFVTYGDVGHEVLAKLVLDGRSAVVLHDIGDNGAYSVGKHDTIGFAAASFTRPDDVAILTANGAVQPLTHLNARLLEGKSLARGHRISFRSPADGALVRGWVLPPSGALSARRPPLILSIHGGPHDFDDTSWSTEDQLFAAAGYAVLHVDYRGSLSYGYAFADAAARDTSCLACDDLMGGVDSAVGDGYADADHLYLTGGSAGGELAAWLVGRTKRFKAAVAVKPIINAISNGLTTVQYGATRSVYGVFPWEDPNLYWRRSPLSLVGSVVTPTLLMVGEYDRNTPATEAEQFYDALQLRGIPSMLVIVPEAGHGSIAGTPSRAVSGIAITLAWFARYGGLPTPATIVLP